MTAAISSIREKKARLASKEETSLTFATPIYVETAE